MKSVFHKQKFLKTYRKAIRFFLFFILFFILGQLLHYLTQSYTAPLFVHRLNAEMSSKIINILTPNEKTFYNGPVIGSENFSIAVEKGCEGIEGIILISAAILAFSASVKEKIFAILVASTIMYVTNLVRIIVLYFTFKYKPELFNIMHIFIGQTVIIFVGVLFFIIWISKFVRMNENTK